MENQLIDGNTLKSPPDSRIVYGAKKMTDEDIRELESYYVSKGWTIDHLPGRLGFISECGRWIHDYDKETSRFYIIDGWWKVNLVSTKRENENGDM